MSTVYIIGNGFDLNLGLKTSYRDFVTSNIFNDRIKSGNSLFDHLHKININSNWIDIEKELITFSRYYSDKYFLRNYKELCTLLKQYIKNIDLSQINTNSRAYNLFSNDDTEDQVTIINFNYTETISNIFESKLNREYDNVKIINIHGDVKTDEIIFGVDDTAKINEDHTFLYKSSSSIYNGRDCINALKSFKNLHIFGHSLGESDHMYLEFFRYLSTYEAHEDKEINIYHYGEEDKYRIHKQLHTLTGNNVSKLKNNTLLSIIDAMES
jgi:hypothetical protein